MRKLTIAVVLVAALSVPTGTRARAAPDTVTTRMWLESVVGTNPYSADYKDSVIYFRGVVDTVLLFCPQVYVYLPGLIPWASFYDFRTRIKTIRGDQPDVWAEIRDAPVRDVIATWVSNGEKACVALLQASVE